MYCRLSFQRLRAFAIIPAGVVISLLAAAQAASQAVDPSGSARADVVRQEAVELLDAGRPADALRRIRELRAIEADKVSSVLYLEAQAEEALGRLNRALGALEQYLDGARPDDRDYAKARQQAHSLRPRAREAAVREVLAELDMVAVPAGTFRMGDLSSNGQPNELPVHTVSVRAFKLARREVTVAQFQAFVTATGYSASGGCYVLDAVIGRYGADSGASWRKPGYPVHSDDPAGCLSWNDAKAFIAWLARESGRRLRLPSEAEWEYAARAGTTTPFPWGDRPEDGCRLANGADRTPWPGGHIEWTGEMDCLDGWFWVAPAGALAPNTFGLHDMIGNVWEWTEDCWNATYIDAPTDGSAWLTGDCSLRVYRGGAWNMSAANLRVSYRGGLDPAFRNAPRGLRVAEDV